MEWQWTTELILLVLGLAIVILYVDATVGLGYGTLLVPLFIGMGMPPGIVVPALIGGQLVGGAIAGYFHNRVGNISIKTTDVYASARGDGELGSVQAEVAKGIKKEAVAGGPFWANWSTDTKVIAIFGFVGAIAGVFGAIVHVGIPAFWVSLYIGVMITTIGIWLLITQIIGWKPTFTLSGLWGVGAIAGFNKGLTGGGYGPIVTAGQLATGRGPKSTVGCTTTAEVIVSSVAFITYLIVKGVGEIDWLLLGLLCAGALVGAPLSAKTVKIIPGRALKSAIAVVIIMAGIWALSKALGWR